MAGFGGAVKLTGESEYRRALNQITQNLREVSSEMKAVSSQYDKNDNSIAALTAKEEALNNILSAQKDKLSLLKSQYNDLLPKVAEQAEKHKELVDKYNEEKAKLESLGATLGKSSAEYKAQQATVESLALEVKKSATAYDANEKSLSNLRVQMNNTEAEINNTAREMDDLGKAAEESGKDAQKASEGYTVFKNVLANLSTQAINAAINGLKKLGGTFVDVMKQSVDAYGEYEQLVGGVETLFGDSADQVQKYAENAYKTAGLSANDYMSTVTGFSASLLQSLDGDTAAAAEAANTAITDMSDNANKMGTDMASIQNAYQGFAKQNYTMLDNLKLGYGGTKTEMERLIADANKLKEAQGEVGDLSIESYADVVEAIHTVQTEMKISGLTAEEAAEMVASGAMTEQEAFEAMGTTAKEASTTIQGSMSSMKSAYQNVLVAFADSNADVGKALTNLVDSAKTVLKNLLPVVKQALSGITQAIKELAPEIIKIIPGLIKDILPPLLDAIMSMTEALADVAPDIIMTIANALIQQLPKLINSAVKIVTTLVNGISDSLPKLIPVAIEAIKALGKGLADNLPVLVKAAGQLVVALVRGIVENLPQMLNAAGQLIGSLGKGIGKAIPSLVSTCKTVLASIAEVFNPANAIKWAKDMIAGLIQGLTSATSLSSIANGAKTVAGKIASFLHFSVPDEGPLTEYLTWMPDFVEGLARSLSASKYKLTDALRGMTGDMAAEMNISSNSSTIAGARYNQESNMVSAFKEALSEMKIVLDDEVAGSFVETTVTRAIYA